MFLESDELVRLLSAFLTGALITQNGSYCQTLTQNPLASPSTLGVQAFSLGIFLVSFFLSLFFDINLDSNFWSLPIISFHFGLLGLFIFYFKFKNNLKFGKNFIILGLCFNLLIASIFSGVQFLMLNLGIRFPSELWFGSFRFSNNFDLIWLIFLFILSFSFTSLKGKKFRVVLLGSDFSRNYLRDLRKLQLLSFLLVLYINGIITLRFGYFSFLGLVFPHFLRSFNYFRKDVFNELMVGSLLGGLIFMIFDFLCFHFPISGAELPVGMISSVIGPMVLIVALIKNNKTKTVY